MTPTRADANKLLLDGAIALAEIEHNGIPIATRRLEQTIVRVERDIALLEAELRQDEVWQTWTEHYGTAANLDSGKQLGHVLFNLLKYPCASYTASSYGRDGSLRDDARPSTREADMADVDHPFVKKLYHVRHLKKTVGTFLHGIRREVVDGYLHPSFNLHTVIHYRSSSTEPNFQNLPRRDEVLAKLVRSCFIPRPGYHFWEVDFKGIEVAVAACINRDPNLIAYVSDKSKDMHRDMAAKLFIFDDVSQVDKAISRDRAKNQFVFPEFYGSYYREIAKGLWDSILRVKGWQVNGVPIRKHLKKHGIKNPEDFERHVQEVEEYFWGELFPVYKQWKEDWWQAYQEQGYYDTPTGFRIQFNKQFRLLSKNECINYVVSGSAFHCLLWTLIRLLRWLRREKLKTKVRGQIHDSAVGDSPPDELPVVLTEATRIVREDLPRHWPWLIVALEIECEVAPRDRSWFQKTARTQQEGTWGPKKG